MRRTSRNSFSFPDFSLRRLLLQGARAARGSPQLGTRLCDIEKGGKPSSSHSNKHNSDSTSQHSGSSPGGGVVDRTSSCKLTPNSQKSTTNNNSSTKTKAEECPLCYYNVSSEEFHSLLACKHFACRDCLENYLKIEISESRTDISCPQCSEPMHPTDIQDILKSSPQTMAKYEDFMVRRVLIADPDTRWCPAPDCSYAVIATGCASCPRIKCERPGCDVNFCYHCKATWHPDQTCDAARASRQSPTRAPSGSISQDSQHKDDIKPCPRCQVLIVKMDDGSCNHMVCAICGSEFCWLCMKEISDLHYLSPSGCTFWGKKPWSRKKKLLWQLGTLVGAPLGIALVAGIAVPAMIIGIPVWVGKKIHTRYSSSGKHKRNCAVLGGVTASVVISPVLAGLAIAIGVPILLFYVYGVVPVSLCRAGCGDKVKFEFDEEEDNGSRNHDAASVDAVSRIGATSIGEVSLSVASGSHLGVLSQHSTYTVANPSTTALAGSITGHRLEVQVDVSTSETASAVTCVSEKSGITINDSASTKALAGSISSQYRQHNEPNFSEDGVSEKETGADKASLCSGRSFRSSERSFRDELDSNSVSSSHKRNIFGQRIPKSQRTVSLDSTTGSNNIPENEPETPGNSVTASPQATSHENDLKLHLPIEEQLPNIQENAAESPMRSIEEEQNAKGGSPAIKPNDDTDSPKPVESKSVTKTNILRNLFFFQNETGESSASKSTTT